MTLTLTDLLLADRREAGQTVEAALRNRLPTIPVPADVRTGDLFRPLAESVAAFLDTPVADLLHRAWDQHRAVRRACEETRDRPTAEQRVSAGEHELHTTQKATIALDLPGRPLPLLEVLVDLTLTLRAFVVTVKGGEVVTTAVADGTSDCTLGVAFPGRMPWTLLGPVSRRVALSEAPTGRPAVGAMNV